MLQAEIAALSERYYPYVQELRREFHRYPEVSWKEYRTSRRIVEELEKMGVPYQAGCGAETNVAAWIHGTKPGEGRTILLRADMDALPIQEDESHPLCSENPGVMHACAHDGHVAGMLGAVRILNELKDRFSGIIKIAFEAGEEDGGGANGFIQAGFLDDVEAVFGCHLFGTVREGRAALRVGNFMSASDAVRLKIRGGQRPLLHAPFGGGPGEYRRSVHHRGTGCGGPAGAAYGDRGAGVQYDPWRYGL